MKAGTLLSLTIALIGSLQITSASEKLPRWLPPEKLDALCAQEDLNPSELELHAHFPMAYRLNELLNLRTFLLDENASYAF